MRCACNLSCEPSPVTRWRNNPAIPQPQINLSHGLRHWWLTSDGAESNSTKDFAAFVNGVPASATPDGMGDGAHPTMQTLATPDKFGLYPWVFPSDNYLEATPSQNILKGDGTTLANGLAILSGSVTFAVWVYWDPLGASTNQVIYIFDNTNGANQPHFSLFMDSTGLATGVFKLVFYFNRADNKFFTVDTPVNVISPQRWTLLVCGYDDSANNGGAAFVSVNASPIRYSLLPPSNGVGFNYLNYQVGRKANGTNYFRGRMFQFAVWTRVLNAAEIASLFTTSLVNSITEDIFTEPAGPTGQVSFFAASGAPPPAFPPPSNVPDLAPTGLTTAIDGSNHVDLSWLNNAVNAMAIEIWRSDDGAAFALVGTVNSYREDTYHDGTADTSGHSYIYRIRAVNLAGASAWSEEVPAAGTGSLLTEAGDNLQTEDGRDILLE